MLDDRWVDHIRGLLRGRRRGLVVGEMGIRLGGDGPAQDPPRLIQTHPALRRGDENAHQMTSTIG